MIMIIIKTLKTGPVLVVHKKSAGLFRKGDGVFLQKEGRVFLQKAQQVSGFKRVKALAHRDGAALCGAPVAHLAGGACGGGA